MNNQYYYYKSLELHKITAMLRDEASNEETRHLISELAPCKDLETAQAEMLKTSEAFELCVKHGSPYFVSFKDVSLSLHKAKQSGAMTIRELLNNAEILYQTRMLNDWYRETSYAENSISYLFESLEPNDYLEEKIKNAIESEDEISDNASLNLARIRKAIAKASYKIRESLDKMTRNAELQKSLQDNIVTMRDGRYVLPVKAECKGAVNGLVHATSATGATYFIEPISVVEANNEIRVLQGEEKDEIERIIAELSADCADYSEQIINNYNISAELNLYFAKANLGAKMRGSAPVITDSGITKLKKARHPLINPTEVVPIDIEIGEDYNALIVTGPNTGGKTVILKTVGLLTCMAMCGLLIPAGDGSVVSIFDNILVDIGDKQSIEMSLSTFSSHIGNVVEILEKADEKSLVLLDELGSGTDPVEGAALAVSIIEKLSSKGSRMIVTTHYQELKLFALETPGIENASCEFDVLTLKPTYKVIIGSPGKSNAFSISSRLGITSDIIERAKDLVSTENQRFEEAISRLEASRIALEKDKNELKRLLKLEEEKSAKIEAELLEISSNKEREFEKARVEAMRIVESCRVQSEELIDELTEIRKHKEKEKFSEMAITAKTMNKTALDKMYKTANPVVEVKRQEYVLPRKLVRGDNVLIFDINKKGILASDPDKNGNVYVQAGIMKTKVNISKLRLLEKEKVTLGEKKISTKSIGGKITRSASMELDIRGYAVDEGILEVDSFIDNAVLTGRNTVTIIHGKGTGILRVGIQKHLKSHSSVKSYRNGLFGEGEEGVTVVELK